MIKALYFLFTFFLFTSVLNSQTAVQPPGSGIQSDPFLISTLDHLYWFSQSPLAENAFIKQIKDIDASATSTWDGGQGYNPPVFRGTYNGMGHIISNLFIRRYKTDLGFIGSLWGKVLNLGIENANVSGHSMIGALVGYSYGGKVLRCYSTGIIAGHGNSGGLIGHIAGEVAGNKSYNYESWSSCNVTDTSNFTGGFAGYKDNVGDIIRCFALGNVSAPAAQVGGFAGYGKDLFDCFARGNVYGLNTSAGFINNCDTLYRCYSTGTVNIISNSSNCGFNFHSDYPLEDCFWDVQTSGTAIGYNGIGLSTAEMKTQFTYTSRGYDFINVWIMDPSINDGYPTFRYTLPVTISYPDNGSVGQPRTPRLKWQILGNTGTFKVEIASDADFNNIIYSCITTNTFKDVPQGVLSHNTVYHWRVRTYELHNGDELLGRAVSRWFRVIDGAVTAPTPSWPIGGATTYLQNQDLNWYCSTGGPGYTYEVELSETFNDFDAHPGTTYTSQITNFRISFILKGATTFYWRVRSYNAAYNLFSAFSPTASFVTDVSVGPVVPFLSYPINGATVYSAIPELHWYTGAAPVGIKFSVLISTNRNFPDSILINNISNTYLEYNCIPGTKYYWKVRSSYNGFNSAFSAVDSFCVTEQLTGNPVVPVISWPVAGTVMYSVNPTIYWYLNTYSSGMQFRVQYKKHDEQIWLGPFITDQLFYQLTNLQPGTFYDVKVQSFVGLNSSDPCTVTFKTTLGNGPSAPQLSYPTGGVVVYTTEPVLNWWVNSSVGIDHYSVRYSFNSDLSNSLYEGTTISTSLNLQGLPVLIPGGTYYWGVTAFDAAGNYTESLIGSFTIAPGLMNPVTPITGSPKNGIVVGTVSPTFSWGLPVNADNLIYELQYSKSPDFSNAVEIKNITELHKSVTGLQSGIKYYWRVRSSKNGVNTAYTPASFFIPVNGVTDIKNEQNIIPEKFTVEQNYPNPFNPSTTLTFGIPGDCYVSIKIYNMLGQEVRTLIAEEKNAGAYKIIWNGDNNSGKLVTSGTYIYRVYAGNEVISKKLIIIK